MRKCFWSDAKDTGALARGHFAASDGATHGTLADPKDRSRLARGVRPIVRGTGHQRVRDGVHRLLIHGNGSIPDGRTACKGLLSTVLTRTGPEPRRRAASTQRK